MPHLTRFAIALLAAATAACSTPQSEAATTAHADSVRVAVARAHQDSINRAQPGYVVDSIFPPEVELSRFRKALGGDSAKSFRGGSSSREALAQRFVHALARSDTADLRTMVIHGREFADLYYPESPFSRAPYHQPPDLAWRLIQDPSTRGFTRLMKKVAGKPMTYAGIICDPKVSREGRNTRFAGCLVRLIGEKGDTVNRLYFGSIVERDGQFKFLSYTNSL